LPLPLLSLFINIFVWPTAISLDAAILISVIFAGPVDGVASTDAAGDGVALAFGDGVLGTGISTPLSQTIFFPDLIAVNFLLRQTITCPMRFGFSAGFSIANAEESKNEKITAKLAASIPRRLNELITKS
jgi:hypothetical protein